MMARDHMHRYGTTRKQLAEVAVKNHHNGSKNPRAQFPMEVTVEQVEESVLVADPLRILDCSPITDGAAAVILVPLGLAHTFTGRPPVRIAASAHATDSIALHERDDLAWLGSTERAAGLAYAQAGITPEDLSFCEVHDCFTIAEIMVIEALGISPRGCGGSGAESGATALGGKVPVNPSGGLKSKGHPIGATGAGQVYEVTKQLRGELEPERLVEGAKIGMTDTLGGDGSTVVNIILQRGW